MKETVKRNPRWWHECSATERCLAVVAGVAIFMVIVMSIILVILAVTWNKDKSSICLTPVCIRTASDVLNRMDNDVDPCEDFYKFACGSYIKETVLPDDKSSIDDFDHNDNHLKNQLRVILAEPKKKQDAKHFLLAKNLYAACMNKSLIEERGLQSIKSILKQMGGWPVLEGDAWNIGKFSWKGSVYSLRKYGFSADYFIDFTVKDDCKNSTNRSINLDQASLGLNCEYLVKGMNDQIVSAYYQYQLEVAVIMGADRERAAKELQESLEFEMKLANISMPDEERRDMTKLCNPMTVETLQIRFPSIPWLEYVNNLLPPSVQVNNNEVIVINDLSFIQQLEHILSNTSKRVIANYVMTRAMLDSVSYLTNNLRSKQLKFTTARTGKTEIQPRWKECVNIVRERLPLAVGSLYVQNYFKQEAKKNIFNMVQNIRNEFYEILKSVDWMDEETRQHGLEKAYAMTVHIAYPDELLDKDKLEEFYKSLDASKDLYHEIILNIYKFDIDFYFGRLRQKVNKTEWLNHARSAIVNAFYYITDNCIELPAGILQGYFFNNERPYYMNYGAIGTIIGHEITHGFDDRSRQFNKDGNLVDWWTSDTKEKYLEKAQCIIEQYGNYTDKVTGLKLNGIKTQGENIADNGGTKEAYHAYVTWTRRHGEEPHLPGLEFSPRQLFWISAAQSSCSKTRPEYIRESITTHYHCPEEFRVLGPLSNLEEFAADFNCPKGSKMNPVEKCSVW